uniref:Synaptotagmin like 1 n=1 Tax=Chrysemys picta bellii TaxID=8478 RepID=A0A8C3PE33_CHRPI
MSSSVSSLSSGSMMSLYSDSDVGNVEVRGCVQFALQYEAKKKELQIRVIQCRDLAEAKKQRSDPAGLPLTSSLSPSCCSTRSSRRSCRAGS